jgi:hypothetical protein
MNEVFREKVRPIRFFLIILLSGVLLNSTSVAFEAPDAISALVDSPVFKRKEPIQKLLQAAELVREKKLQDREMAFAVLDWGDRYVREPSDPLDRLKRWAQLSHDEKLSQLRIPREFLNRVLLAEYLVKKTAYITSPPQKKLEILHKLAQQKLVDWAVSLAYARLYAGAILTGAKSYRTISPIAALDVLKDLEEQGLVGLHYKTPTEALLAAEALAMDSNYMNGLPYDRLVKLRDLERKKLISNLTRKELERLPAWRLLVSDPTFMQSDAASKKERLSELRDQGLISSSSFSDLTAIFRPVTVASPAQTRPIPVPQKIQPPAQQGDDTHRVPNGES